jgi:hypothetical protein
MEKKLLIAMLRDHRYKFRKLETLAAAIGKTEEETRAMLIEIKARKSRTGVESYALIARIEPHRQPTEEEIVEAEFEEMGQRVTALLSGPRVLALEDQTQIV